MTLLVVGGTGQVGSEVVKRLAERGKRVRVPTRSAEKLGRLPDGVEGVVGDLADPTTYGAIFDGATAMFLLNALTLDELQQGLAAVNEARRVGIGHVVYQSVADAETAPHVPHFAAKVAIEWALRESGLDWTLIRPNSFFQNDLALRPALAEHGVYPLPMGSAGVSRVDVRDIADAVVAALEGGRWEERSIDLCGPDVLTGEDCAAIWGEALGREVRYGGDDLDAWAAQMRQLGLPEWLIYDLTLMWKHFQDEGLAASDEQLEATREILGREPRSYRDFVRETAASWS